MQVITRFAPSPTGLLHVGNIRTALVNWLFSKSVGGQFILRIDDTDLERSKEEYVQKIQHDLKWLGLEWDSTFKQSNRLKEYEAAKQKLIDMGRLYPCYETQEDLEIKRKMLLSRNLPPIYDRASLKLSEAQKAEMESKGRKPHWRFLLKDESIKWKDEIRGEIQFEGKNLTDPILIRENGTMTYILSSVVDDIDSKISHIIRGEDHISNSAIQIQIFEALGAKAPNMAHLSLLTNKNAEISKRLGGFDIETLRSQGIEALSINAFLAKLGTSDAIEIKNSLEDLVKEFSIHKFSHSGANYDFVELERFNKKFIHHLSFDHAKKYLEDYNLSHITEDFWETVKGNVNKIEEVQIWWNITKKAVVPQIENLEFTKKAASLLPEGEISENTWNEWLEKIKMQTGLSGKALFIPIRKALTAMEHGPELKYILPIIGREKIIGRLNGETA